MEFTLEFFGNERYNMLKFLSTHQTEIKGELVVSMSQQDIGDTMPISKLKTNEILNELQDEGFISVPRRSRYKLTEKGAKALKLMEKKNV